MTDSRAQQELAEAKSEIQRLKERMSLGAPTVHKDLSLISLVPKWSGLDSAVILEEFFASIEASAKIGSWEENDQREIAVLRLTASAMLFYQSVRKSTEKERHGRFSRMHLDGVTRMRTPTSTTLRNCKQRGKQRMRALRSLQIGVEP